MTDQWRDDRMATWSKLGGYRTLLLAFKLWTYFSSLGIHMLACTHMEINGGFSHEDVL